MRQKPPGINGVETQRSTIASSLRTISIDDKIKMKCIETTRHIHARIESVFQTIADVRNFAKAVPHITNIEFLTEQQYGVGTKFRETRDMNGKPATVDLEVTEYIENERVRIVSDAGGTVWDTVFTVRQAAESVAMHMVMEARAHKLMARLINPLIRGMVAKAVEADMDAVKAYCESETP